VTCLRCGGGRMFRRVGPDVQTDILMCVRCDRNDRFTQAVADQSIDVLGQSLAEHPCEVCGREACAWGPGHAGCLEHWDPVAP
jgi:hypothetical protein